MKEKKYPRDFLVTSKKLKKFNLNKYMLRGLLPNDEYSLEEAEKIIEAYINSFKEEK